MVSVVPRETTAGAQGALAELLVVVVAVAAVVVVVTVEVVVVAVVALVLVQRRHPAVRGVVAFPRCAIGLREVLVAVLVVAATLRGGLSGPRQL